MCIVPKLWLIDSWLCYWLLLNYLYLVTLELWRCPCIYVLLFHKDMLSTTLLCLVYYHKHTVSFNELLFMILFLSYFSCYNIVAKFYWIISIMSMLEYLDPSSQCFTCLIKIVLASCHLKNYFVITYLLKDEQELSLGMLIVSNVSIIFDASCLFYTNCYIFGLHFVALLCIFRH